MRGRYVSHTWAHDPSLYAPPKYRRACEYDAFVPDEITEFNPAIPAEVKTTFISKLVSRYTWLNDELAGKEFLLGDHFTVADAYLFTVTNWAAKVGVDLTALANIQAFQARIAARPAVQEALKAEGLI